MAVSYDPVEALAAFAEQFGVTYPLLSDTGSAAIRALGLENVYIEAYNRSTGVQTTSKHAGLPYPGTFELDAGGVVVAKHFEQRHRERPSATVLLADELRRRGLHEQVSDAGVVSGVPVSASLATTTYHPQQLLECRVRLSVPAGRHVYVGDVPVGYRTLRVALGGSASLRTQEVSPPAGRHLRIEALGEEFSVVDGDVEMAIPFRVATDEGDLELIVEVSLQSCSDSDCLPPGDVRLTLPLRAGGSLRP